jgi:N-acetylglucosamine-6-phosphate deacetylase
MPSVLVNGRVVNEAGVVEGLAVVIEGDRIAAVCARAEAPVFASQIDLQGRLLAPGFIDTQVNGGGGVLFNQSPTLEGIRAIGRAHRRFGTTGFLPTLISDDFSVIREAIGAVGAAIAEKTPGVLGIHIEGPFLNAVRKGIHDDSKFRSLDDEALSILTSLKRGKTLVTLAPEKTGSDAIRRLAEAGVIVSAGHTNATYGVIREALGAGLTGFTHLFNAMSPLTSRSPGVVGAALEDQSAWCGVIVDGRHVHPTILKIAFRCRPIDSFMLVTDAMPSVGSDASWFDLQGRRITVADGACFDEAGTLAGSNLNMAGAIRNARDLLGLDLKDAIAIASRAPAAFLGLSQSHGEIAAGRKANLVLMDDDLTVTATWIDGVFETSAGGDQSEPANPRDHDQTTSPIGPG